MAIATTSFRWEADFLDRVDQARGLASRTQFVAQCVEAVLEGGEESINAILSRVPETRTPVARALTVGEAMTKVKQRHAEQAAARRAKQDARLGKVKCQTCKGEGTLKRKRAGVEELQVCPGCGGTGEK